jgi:teichuronic acid biosynthesis glycosyltransferase TuaG
VQTRTNTPLVSIISPAFNSTAYLSETVRSALEQTYSNLELLIVDDESTDGTIELARQWMTVDPRVKAWTIPHGGPSMARNAAIARARGEFFALLDSDDIWKPNFLEEQVRLLTSGRNISIVTANAINHGGGFDGRPLWPVTTEAGELGLLDIITHEDSVCIMTAFHRDVPGRLGGFDARFDGNEDYHFWLRATAAGFRILRNPTPLGFYRRRPNSVSADDRRMLRGIIAVLRDIAAHHDLSAEAQHAIDRQVRRFEDEISRLDVRGFLDQRDADGAARSLQEWARARGKVGLGALSNVARWWPRPLVWLYDLRRTLRTPGGSRV